MVKALGCDKKDDVSKPPFEHDVIMMACHGFSAIMF